MSRTKKNRPIRVLIDGYNLIFTCGLQGRETNPTSLARARRRLEQTIRTHVPDEELMAIWIIYDSNHGGFNFDDDANDTSDRGPVARFAHDYEDADEMIEALIGQSSIPGSLIVVSGDHRIQEAARRRNCHTVTSEEWYDRLVEGHYVKTSFSLTGQPDSTFHDQDLDAPPDEGLPREKIDLDESPCALMDPAEIQELLEDVKQLENIDLLDPSLTDIEFDQIDLEDLGDLDVDDDLLSFE